MKNKSEKQHYVPQFLLRNFHSRKRAKAHKNDEYMIYVFDKHTDKIFEPNIIDIASEKGFYELFGEKDDAASIESKLSELESHTKKALDKIILHESFENLVEEDIAWLSLFVVIQFLRVKSKRELIKDIVSAMERLVHQTGQNLEDFEGFSAVTEEDIKTMTIESMGEQADEYLRYMSGMNWLLFKNTTDKSFYIGDSPVVLHNDNDFRPYGNIGFAVKGIQIYLPISKTMTIAFWCPSILHEYNERLSFWEKEWNNLQAKLLLDTYADKDSLSKQLAEVSKNKNMLVYRLDMHNKGLPIEISDENVTFYNWLQVKGAHRFVMCGDNSFELATRMIADNNSYRKEQKISFN